MSKRRELYQHGLERLQHYCEILCREAEPPTLQDIQGEILAIPALRALPIRIHLPDAPSPQRFALIAEHYDRYDDLFPKVIDIRFMPPDMDDDKTLHRFLRELD